MVYITHVRLSAGGYQHEHITDVRWLNPDDRQTGQNTVAEMVQFIGGGGVAKVTVGSRTVDVLVVRATPPYIRTYADGVPTNNLLELPRF